ncbi:YciI family protein [Saccharomonospora sp. NPDC006951]
MYVVLLTYTAPRQELDYVLPDHVKWVEKQYDHSYFIASGRRDLHLGEVMITRPMTRGKLDAVLATDPLVLAHYAHYEVVEFSATRTCPELRLLNEAVPH